MRRRLLQDHGCVGPAEPERVDDSKTRSRREGKLRQPRTDRELPCVHVNAWIGRREVQARRNLAVLDTQRGLDQPGDSGCRLEVSDVGLDRADQAALAGRARATEYGPDGLRLDRIAHRRAGPVRLDIGHLDGIDPGAAADLAKHRNLRIEARHRQRARLAVLVHRRGADDGAYAISVRECSGQRLEDDDAGAFAADIAVRPRVERLATPVGREHRGAAERDRHIRREHEVHTADEGHGALAAVERAAREIERHQR